MKLDLNVKELDIIFNYRKLNEENKGMTKQFILERIAEQQNENDKSLLHDLKLHNMKIFK